MDNDKKKKILAIVATSVISLIVSVAATVIGVQPDELVHVDPDSAIETIFCDATI